jgi:hypothetical protein
VGRQRCVGCSRLSPETNGEGTLTTSYGWRIRKVAEGTGAGSVEWRCPPCWQRFKASQGGAVSTLTVPPSSSRPGSGPPEGGKR